MRLSSLLRFKLIWFERKLHFFEGKSTERTILLSMLKSCIVAVFISMEPARGCSLAQSVLERSEDLLTFFDEESARGFEIVDVLPKSEDHAESSEKSDEIFSFDPIQAISTTFR